MSSAAFTRSSRSGTRQRSLPRTSASTRFCWAESRTSPNRGLWKAKNATAPNQVTDRHSTPPAFASLCSPARSATGYWVRSSFRPAVAAFAQALRHRSLRGVASKLAMSGVQPCVHRAVNRINSRKPPWATTPEAPGRRTKPSAVDGLFPQSSLAAVDFSDGGDEAPANRRLADPLHDHLGRPA
jgi:hypothetical protein